MVANSPGLIAGSYVLHRLLVPRHPPIALSSLSHNKKLQRCSRPLYSSQNTGRNTNPYPPLTSNNAPSRENPPFRNTITRSLVKAGPSHTPTPIAIRKDPTGVDRDPEKPVQPDHSGSARFLRTQQRASAFHPTQPRVPRRHLRRESAVLAGLVEIPA